MRTVLSAISTTAAFNAPLLAYGGAPSVQVYSPAAPVLQPATYAAPYAEPIDAQYAVQYAPVAQAGAPLESGQAGSQGWLWLGVGASVLGAAAATRRPQRAVAEPDLEAAATSARLAALAVSGSFVPGVSAIAAQPRGGEAAMGPKKKEEPWSLTSFLMGGRKDFSGKANGELELLSGQTRPPSDDKGVLARRFKVGYDTRPKKPVKVKSKSGKINPKDASTW